jgi:A/G-specific adenine glycosylase
MAAKREKNLDQTGSAALRFSFDSILAGKELVRWYRKNARPLPWRVLFATHKDAYHVWVSEIMLQQTVIKAVLPAYERFLKAYPTVKDLANTDEESLRLVVRGLGYYRRFGFLLKAARTIVNDYKEKMPVTFDEWKSLPGIGDYTAAAISSIAFGECAAVVDGNVERVFCRLLDIRLPPNLPRLKKEFKTLAASMIYKSDPGSFNQGLMELGQTVCTVSQPNCVECPLQTFCLAAERKSQHLAPAPKIKKDMQELSMRLHVFRKGGKIGVVRRPKDARFLGGTRGFFTEVRGENNRYKSDGTLIFASEKLSKPVSLGSVKHHITHHKIEAQVFLNQAIGKVEKTIEWLPYDQVEENLVSNLDRKAWRLIENTL